MLRYPEDFPRNLFWDFVIGGVSGLVKSRGK